MSKLNCLWSRSHFICAHVAFYSFFFFFFLSRFQTNSSYISFVKKKQLYQLVTDWYLESMQHSDKSKFYTLLKQYQVIMTHKKQLNQLQNPIVVVLSFFITQRKDFTRM